MSKRKEISGPHLAQEPRARSPLRKRARLLESGAHDLLPVQSGNKQRRENGQCRALLSSSTTGSIRWNRYPTLQSSNSTKSTNDTSFERYLGKTHSAPPGLGAGNKRKQEKELGQADIEPRTQTRNSEPTVFSPHLKLPRDDGLCKKQNLQFDETVQKTNPPATVSAEKPAKELGVQDVKQKERHDPISYWAAHHTWPKSFTEQNSMASSNINNKRQRTLDRSRNRKDERPWTYFTYSQSRRDGEVPEQFTAAYERHILSKGLNMDHLKGEELVSEESKKLCSDLQQITNDTIAPSVFPAEAFRKVINYCLNRNEAIVNRDVTTMIIPSITSLYFGGDKSLEHVIDEVNADWYEQCILIGPRIRPDLAIGLFSSAFTEEELEKMKRYSSVDNWTQITMHMFFPFFMGEVKCGRESLNIADRQNMHSCSVAVRALLRIEQEADKYRPEKKMDSLNRQVLVFSISHDQQDARLHGHYATIEGDKWTYHRYRIRKFDLFDNNSLLAVHNFVRNILKSYLPKHLRRLKDAVAALPDPNTPPESSSLLGSSRTYTGSVSLNDLQGRDADCFVVPARPDK